jgi:hypothetical protein
LLPLIKECAEENTMPLPVVEVEVAGVAGWDLWSVGRLLSDLFGNNPNHKIWCWGQ